MGKYSISDLEKLSGVKAHTIRIWEQRYGLLSPLRTESNIRYYDDDQLRKLLNVSSLIKRGIKISHISKLTDKEVYALLDEIEVVEGAKNFHTEVLINQLISSSLSYNESLFEKTFASAILKFGFEETYEKILYPFLIKLGMMWGKEEVNPAQEHFLSNLIKQKILTAIDSLPVNQDSKYSFVLFLNEEEDHEIGLLFSYYLLKKHKFKVIYLGQRVPLANLFDAVNFCKPTHLMTFFVKHQSFEEIDNLIQQITDELPKIKLVVSGQSSLVEGIEFSKNVVVVNNIEDFYKGILSLHQ